MAIVWLPSAQRDLDEIDDQIMVNSPVAAEREVAKIIEASEHLHQFRHLGRAGRWPESRELVIERKYILAYRESDEDIELIAVLRAERQWPETSPDI